MFELPFGRGCWRCHVGRPIVALDRSSLCFNCLSNWFGDDDAVTAGFLQRNLNYEQNTELLTARKVSFDKEVAAWKVRL